MIGDTIKELRSGAGLSQAELARRLDISRASVNAWESGLSCPTAYYIVELAKLFRVSTDYLLHVENKRYISLDGLSEKEITLIYNLLDCLKKRDGKRAKNETENV